MLSTQRVWEKLPKAMQVLTHSALAPCPWSPAPPSYLSSAIQPVQCHPLSTPLTSTCTPSSFYTCPAVGAGTENNAQEQAIEKGSYIHSSDCFSDSKNTPVQDYGHLLQAFINLLKQSAAILCSALPQLLMHIVS